MKENYRTIRQSGNFSQIIKKSEFICSIARCQSEKEALDFIDQVSNQHNKARHNCFAFMVGLNDQIQRASDNGEPSGTAGVPILNALKQNHLHNVVAVVTRYFGGIKLGTGGLIRAYNGTTAKAIRQIGIVERIGMNEVQFQVEYSRFEKVKYYLEQHDVHLSSTDYAEKITLTVLLPHAKINHFEDALQNFLGVQLSFTIGKESYADQPVEK